MVLRTPPEKPVVLVVDDDPDVALVCCLHLESAGFRLERAGTGGAAVEATRRLRPALVLLDDGTDEVAVREQRGRLVEAAAEADVRVENVTAVQGEELARYASLLATGTYAAAYLGVGLGRIR